MPQATQEAAALPRSYPILLEVEYKLTDAVKLRAGRGWTASMSGTTIDLIALEELLEDSRIDLLISWPVLLNGRVGLRLWIQGRIIESSGYRVSVKIIRHEFRTKAAAVSSAMPRREMNCAGLFVMKEASSGR